MSPFHLGVPSINCLNSDVLPRIRNSGAENERTEETAKQAGQYPARSAEIALIEWLYNNSSRNSFDVVFFSRFIILQSGATRYLFVQKIVNCYK